MRRLAFVSLLALGCGASTVEPDPEPVDPGPTLVVLTHAEVLPNRDVRTRLENRGGPGSYRVALFGRDPYAPCNGCSRYQSMGESDPINIDTGYVEELTWVAGPTHVIYRIIVYSRPHNTAVWTETARWEPGP